MGAYDCDCINNLEYDRRERKAQLSSEGKTSDLISRQAVLDAIVQCTNCGDEDTLREYVLKHSLDNGWTGGILEALDAVKDLPTVQPELTDEQAIAHLQSSGWMQRHDKEMYESGLREQLADDSNSYDSLLPPAQPEHKVRFADKDHVWIDGKQYISLPRFQEAVKEAQPKEGHWIEGGIYRDVIECNCSECGQLMTTAATVRMNFCPNCGAKMTISTK